MRKTDLNAGQILEVIRRGGDRRPLCFWVNELAALAYDGDPKAEVTLHLILEGLLQRCGDSEIYAAYWGLRNMRRPSQETRRVIKEFDAVPQNERFMVPPYQPHR